MTTLHLNLNQDNIIASVARVALRTRKSPKTGNNYTILTLFFKNGLQIDYLVDKKDLFGIDHAISKISTSQKVDSILNEDDENM